MKKITLSILVALFSFGAVFAQQGIKKQRKDLDPQSRAMKVAERLQSELNLSPEVKEKVYALNLTRFEELSKLRQNRSTNKENHKTQVEAVRAKYISSLKQVLTPEQMKALEAKSGERKEKIAPVKKQLESTPDM